MNKKLRDILFIIIVTFNVILLSSGLFLKFESHVNPEINSFFDAVWLTVVTITSIGYGDSYPITIEGKVVSMFLMFFSIVLIGAIAGIVSHDFLNNKPKKEC